MSALAVTHTGEPGPESISTVGGRSWRIPFLMIETVCPPQNSINLVGLVDSCFILDTSFLASSTSRYSSMNFIQACHLLQYFQCLQGFRSEEHTSELQSR